VSDGTEPPAEVMRRAAEAGLDVVALTDHDTAAGWEQARHPGVRLLPGMELSCELEGRSMHMLAYRFDPAHPELAQETERIRDDRVWRAKAMVDKLIALGAPVSWPQVAAIAGDAVVGRPHIARALAEAGVVESPDQAFTPEWIDDDGRAYVAKYALDPYRAIALVTAAGGVTVLAHPRASRALSVGAELIARLAAAGLAGVEVGHPDHPLAERSVLSGIAADLGLVATAGSDDHGALTGYRIGAETMDGPALDSLLARLP
jgi:predicted metal-dependent phosphoesterase TrpH